MAYDTATKKWKLTWQLIDGKKFSFRAVTAPATVLTGSTGPSLSVSTGAVDNEGTIKAPGTYVSDATKTNYDIEVDLSNPRNYTYTLTPH